MRRTVIALVLATATSGCSWALVRPPPAAPPPPEAPLECTTARDAPYGDVAMAGFMWASTIALLACFGEDCRSAFGWTAVGATAVLGVPAVLSAIYGYRHTGRCRALHVARERWRESLADPQSGAAGHPCRAVGPPCRPGLACVRGTCVEVH